MWRVEVVETEDGLAILLPDDLAAALFLEGKTELDVRIEGKTIVVPKPGPTEADADRA
jgi:antitoxin component of MazEF toxin-antitoxin module